MTIENHQPTISFGTAFRFARATELLQRERDDVLSAMLKRPLPKPCQYLAWTSLDFSDDHLALMDNAAFMEHARDIGLEILLLSLNPRITDRSLPVILRLIQETAIKKLDLSDTNISADSRRSIMAVVHQQNRELKVILDDNLVVHASSNSAHRSSLRF